MKKPQIVVIKVGTDVLQNPLAFFVVSKQIAELKLLGYGVILVSSGGVAAGMKRMTELGGDVGSYPKHLLAGMGARHLLNRWGDAFALHALDVEQFWITYGNLGKKGERASIRSSIRRLAFDRYLVPLCNENDPVSQQELKKMRKGLGDNDRLARIISCLVEADYILFVTIKGGVYSKNPDGDATAVRINRIDAMKRHRLQRKTSGPSKNGSGGMQSKVDQASICGRKGMHAGIIGADDIIRFMRKEDVGTLVAV